MNIYKYRHSKPNKIACIGEYCTHELVTIERLERLERFIELYLSSYSFLNLKAKFRKFALFAIMTICKQDTSKDLGASQAHPRRPQISSEQ